MFPRSDTITARNVVQVGGFRTVGPFSKHQAHSKPHRSPSVRRGLQRGALVQQTGWTSFLQPDPTVSAVRVSGPLIPVDRKARPPKELHS